MKEIGLGKVLSDEQCNEIAKIANDVKDVFDSSTRKKIVEVLEKDDSKWKEMFDKNYLSYAIQYKLSLFKEK